MDKETVKKHPSYGNIRVSRISGQAHLFGSDVQHQHFIEVSIHEGEVRRNLSMDWHCGGKEITAVWMSEMQWAQFVSSFNQGAGTPCTLRHREGKEVERFPEPEPIPSTFEREISEYADESLSELQNAVKRLDEIMKPGAKTLGKKELGEILGHLRTSLARVENGIPFIEKQFTEAMEAKMTEARAAFEGYMNNRLRELGLESHALTEAQAELPKLTT